MRTTLTLDPDVARLIEDEVHRRRATFKDVVNDAIRRGLAPAPRKASRRYRQRTYRSELAPGIDWSNLSQVAESLETDDAIARLAGRRR